MNTENTGETELFLKQANVRIAKIYLRIDGIIQINVKQTEDIYVKDLIEIKDAIGELGEKKAFPNLIYIDHFVNTSSELRAYSASEENNIYTLADAFVINSAALKLVGNFYVSFNKPVRPTRIFTSNKEAIEWLKTFL